MFYKYTYLSKIGKELEGAFKGSKRDLMNHIQENNWTLISIQLDIKSYFQNFIKGKKINLKNLPPFFEEFRDMLATGLPINEIFEALKETNDDKALIRALNIIQESTLNGSSLNNAFRKTGVFSSFVLTSIETGEKGGKLVEVMDNLSSYYKKAVEFNDKIVGQLSYPAFVFIILTGVIFFISFYAVPKIGHLLPGNSSQNILTILFLGISHIVQKFWYLFVFSLFLIIYSLSIYKNKYPVSFAQYYYRLPVWGELAKEKDIAYYFLNLASLSKSGVTLIESLSILHHSNKSYISLLLFECKKYVLSGSDFWYALKKFEFFPRYVFYTVRKGEDIGKLSEYYMKIYNFYLNRVNVSLNRLTSAIQPFMLFVLAGFLIFIVLAFLLPIYSNLTNLTDINVIK